MRITILAFGTRGDVQPILALGKTLKSHGHSLVRSRHLRAAGTDWRVTAIPFTIRSFCCAAAIRFCS
ncbi:MAG TPA: glycosyltransferase [Anaerolineae bacterium]